LHGFTPSQDMLIHAVDQRPVQIEQEGDRLLLKRPIHLRLPFPMVRLLASQ
jgi:hypothetical protein